MPRSPANGRWGAGGETIAERPALAIKIAVIANTWTTVESNMAFALGAMIGSDHRVALAILDRVTTATAKSQMIRSIGKASLDIRIRPKLDVLLGSFDRLARQRNKVVHGLWGTVDVEPEGLLWLPPSAMTRLPLGMMAAAQTGNPLDVLRDVASEFELWEAHDFDSLISELNQLSSAAAEFASNMLGLAMGRAMGIEEKVITGILDKPGDA